MRSTSRRMPEEAGSALDDSTYEFLEEASDDEAHTESVASTDGCTPDDASNFTDDDDEDEEEEEYGHDTRELHHSVAEAHIEPPEQQYDARSIHSAGDSTLTEVPAYIEDHRHSHPRILMEEQPSGEPGMARGSVVYRTFPDEHGSLYSVFSRYRCTQVRFVMRAALSEVPIPTPDSYRILYIGSLDKSEEEAVTSKISDALTACQSTSRSIMVQGQLQPCGPDMLAYHCANIQALSKGEEPARIAVTLENGQQLTFGPGRTATSDAQPDLVVFCHPPLPRTGADAQSYASAREVFDREKVPYLDMISAKQYGYGAPTYDGKGLKVCVEGRKAANTDFELQEVHPVDYYTFTGLEPSQVNRHLASISPHLLSPKDKTARGMWVGERLKKHARSLRETQPAPVKMVFLLIALTGMITAYITAPLLVPMFSKAISSIEAGPKVPLYPSAHCSAPASLALTTSGITSIPTPSISNPVSRDLTLVPPPAKLPKAEKKKSEGTEKTVPFEIQATTNHQFHLVPNEDILSARKKPQLQIQVFRNTEPIPIRFNRTLSGVYIVDLEHQQPFSIFNVNIASYSKPLLQQSFVIGLGHNKSSLAQLLDLTMSGIIGAQRSFLDASTLAAQEILASVSDRLRQRHFQVADVMKREITAGTEFVKNVPEAAWVGIREATAPVRTSYRIRRARLNALRIRCKLETATGLSRTDVGGTESWACSKVRGQD